VSSFAGQAWQAGYVAPDGLHPVGLGYGFPELGNALVAFLE
jgi:hypothetical protein